MDIFLSSAAKNSNQIKNHIIMIINQMEMIIIIIIKIIDRIKKVNSCVCCVFVVPWRRKKEKHDACFNLAGRRLSWTQRSKERKRKRERPCSSIRHLLDHCPDRSRGIYRAKVKANQSAMRYSPFVILCTVR
jgi:hypothetical protein